MLKKALLIALLLVLIHSGIRIQAQERSLGISPAIIENESLLPGNVFTQNFVISHNNIGDDSSISVQIEGDDIKEWITLFPGENFNLAQDKNTNDFQVVIKVPPSAEYKKYSGALRLNLLQKKLSGQVSIIPALKVDIKLNVTDKITNKFEIKNVKIDDVLQRQPLTLELKVENLGNISSAPSLVRVNITDLNERKVHTMEVSNFTSIDPFQTEILNFSFPDLELDPAEYFAFVSIFDDKQEIETKKINFSLLESAPTVDKMIPLKFLIIFITILLLFTIISTFVRLFTIRKNKTNQLLLNDFTKRKRL